MVLGIFTATMPFCHLQDDATALRRRKAKQARAFATNHGKNRVMKKVLRHKKKDFPPHGGLSVFLNYAMFVLLAGEHFFHWKDNPVVQEILSAKFWVGISTVIWFVGVSYRNYVHHRTFNYKF